MNMRSVAQSLSLIATIPLMLALTTAGCFTAEEGNGELGEQALNVDSSFTRVAYVGCVEAVRVDVEVTGEGADNAPKLSVSGDSNLLDRIVAEVQDGQLSISCEGSLNPKLGLTVHVEAPKLDAVSLGGSGDFSLRGATATEFVIQHDGSGDMKVEGLKATSLQITGGGSGHASIEALGLTSVSVDISDSVAVALRGDAKSMEVKGSESGSVDALSLQTDTVYANLVESSSAIVCAKVSIEGAVSESGKLEYDCAPMSVNVTTKDDGVVAPH